MSRTTFGRVRKLPSGRFQARYTGSDGREYTGKDDAGRPLTFDTEGYARRYLERISADIQRGVWKPPENVEQSGPALRFSAYADAWLVTRKTARGENLSPATRRLYRLTLANQIKPSLGSMHLDQITPAVVRQWHAQLPAKHPRQRAAAYSLLSTIMATAADEELIPASPCKIRGAGVPGRVHDPDPATLAELGQMTAATPERYRLMVLLAAWCALRSGELRELRRRDVDLERGVVSVRRGVVQADGGKVVKDPKSRAGKRPVHIPPHLMPAVREHLLTHVPAGPDALLFTGARGGQMASSSLSAWWHVSRAAANRDDMHFHDLRHTGAVLAAATGATLAELMARLGHSTASMALRYQHAAADRDRAIAEALSQLATVTPISKAKSAAKSDAR